MIVLLQIFSCFWQWQKSFIQRYQTKQHRSFTTFCEHFTAFKRLLCTVLKTGDTRALQSAMCLWSLMGKAS